MRLRHQTYQARSELRYEQRRQRRLLHRMVALILVSAVGAGVWGVTLGRAPGARQIAWQNDLGGSVAVAPCVLDDRIFVSCLNGNLYALDADTGQTLWRYSAVFPLRSTPAAADGLVVVGGDDHNVYAVNAINGSEVWRYVTEGPVQSSPVTHRQRVFVGSDDKTVRALRLRTGELLWQFKTRGPVFAAPLAGRGMVYVASLDGHLYALDEESGTLRWQHSVGASIYAAPALSGDRLGFGSDDHHFHILDAITGREVASTATQGAIRTPILGGDQGFWVGGREGRLRLIDTEGVIRREHAVGAAILGQPVRWGDLVLIGTDAGAVLAWNPQREVTMAVNLGRPLGAGVVTARGFAIAPAVHGGVFAVRIEATR